MAEIQKVKELQVNQTFSKVVVELVSKGEPRPFASSRGEGKLCKAAVKDDSGEISLTLWNDQVNQYNEGDTITIENGWCSEYKGEKQISTGKAGTIAKQ
ncbi:MAG: OB-fold nucleic acid binding domain-containing protein [Candidatus Micrarchaeota archaeon]